MTGFRPYKPRRPGTVQAVITAAFDQAGGLDDAADLIGRDPKWCYAAADPDIERRRAASLTYEEARTLTRGGKVVAFAEDMALLAGGVFLPPPPPSSPTALQQALAVFSIESGEAVAEVVRSAADGVLDPVEAVRAVKEIDDALRALMQLRAVAAQAAQGGAA